MVCFPISLVSVFILDISSSLAGHFSIHRVTNLSAVYPRLNIYKGHDTTIEKHPYIVSIFRDDFIPLHFSGSIVSSSWVLVSGDSVFKANVRGLKVHCGSTNASLGTQYDVERIVTHPKFKPPSLKYNFALLQVKSEFKWSREVKKVTLPNRKLKVGSEVVVAGWGNTKNYSERVPTLQEGSMRVLGLEECAKMYKSFGLSFDNTMGCIYKPKSTTFCEGDWSDPVTQDHVLHYIFISANEDEWCSDDAYPAICANVLSATSWIYSVIDGGYEHSML